MLLGLLIVAVIALLIELARQWRWPHPAHPMPLALCGLAAGGVALLLWLAS